MRRAWQSIAQAFATLSPASKRIFLVAGSLFVLCLLTVLTSQRQFMASSSLGKYSSVNFPATPPIDFEAPAESKEAVTKVLPSPDSVSRATYGAGVIAEPRIAYSAELAVTTKDFARARSSMEEILEKHRGYTARLRMIGHSSGSILSATLKVPASEYSPALADLKAVGNIEQDEEAADEIVQQRGDIEGRLQNAQNEERKLQLLLKDRDSKMLDPAALDRQLTALHNEIVQMELQRHTFDSRIVFSNIHFSLREQREIPVESISAQLRAAASAGLSDAIRGISALLLVLVSYGPSFLLWAVILFFPARFLWRRSRVTAASGTA
jgi:Domain of unknown function (DUF4349)